MRRIAEAAYATLPAADRAAFAAYARGVNYFIATHPTGLPLEFTLLGYQPRPWSVVDSLLVCLYMYRDLTTTWRDEILKRDMLANGDRQKVEFLFPLAAGAGPQPGSNAWAIAGSLTASGKPLLSNDMHLDYSLPGIWYMTHLQAPGIDVSGVALPGAPGVMVGHNQRIAWGITNLQFAVQDLYIEQFDDRTGRYFYRGQVEQARPERELIRVKGQPPFEIVVWVTRHGPLYVTDGNIHMALRWTAAEPGAIQFPILDIDRAQNWPQFTAALERFPGPGSNFVYADTAGNIGFHVAGKLPQRRGYQRRRPGRRIVRRFRLGRHDPLRPASLRLQSPQRHHRQRQPEYLSRRISRTPSTAISRRLDAPGRFATCSPRARQMARRRSVVRPEGRLFGF